MIVGGGAGAARLTSNPSHRSFRTAVCTGKSSFMAWLAEQHSGWCRYFIRRDQHMPLIHVGRCPLLIQQRPLSIIVL
jgi:hypothetical protein